MNDKPRRRSLLRFGLRSLFLLMLSVAVFFVGRKSHELAPDLTTWFPSLVQRSGTQVISSTAQFDRFVGFDGKVMVAFTADDGPSTELMPVLDDFARDPTNTAKVGRIDVRTAPELAARHRASRLPMCLVFLDGQVIAQGWGKKTQQELKALIEK